MSATALAIPQVDHPMPWLAAVPAAIDAVAGWSAERRRTQADGYADAIACGADVLWADPQTSRRAEISAEQVRDAIVHGLAILAHRPTGVTFAGLHWHANTDCRACPGPGTWALPTSTLERAARGAFFTPRALAEEIAHNAVGPHLSDGEIMDIVGLQIADIACGSGAFLVAVTRLLAQTHLRLWTLGDARYFTEQLDIPAEPTLFEPWDSGVQTAATMLAVECVYGVDIDPLSVELSRLALALLLPDQDVTHGLQRRVRCGDSLLGDGQPWRDGAPTSLIEAPDRFEWPKQFPEVFSDLDGPERVGFDVVLGNPPYLGGQKLSGTLGESYRQHLIRTIAGGRGHRTVDLAVYFWLRAHELVSELGTVGIIGPANLVRGSNLSAWSDYLTQVAHRTLYRTEYVRRWPSNSAAISCCLLYSVMRRWIDPQFRDHDPDDPGRGAHHTCDFGIDPPRFGETWQPRPGCPRCDALAQTSSLIIRTEHDGQAYEIVRRRPADSPSER